MYCINCGKEISEITTICPHCKNNCTHVKEESGSIGALSIVCFFIPLAGIILYLDWGDINLKKARRAGNWAIIGILFYAIIIASGFMCYTMFPGLFHNPDNAYADEQYYNQDALKPVSNDAYQAAQRENYKRALDYTKSMLKGDMESYADRLFRSYQAVIYRSENKKINFYTRDLNDTDKEFMSKDWMAECLGFRGDNTSLKNQNGEYRLISLNKNIVVIKGLSRPFQGAHQIMVKAVINVKTGQISTELLQQSQF